MPALGMAQETGKLIRWMVAEGARVEKGEPLMEVETDKAVVEVEAPASGVLGGIRVAVGDDVPVGQVIAVIDGGGEGTSSGGTSGVKVTPPPKHPHKVGRDLTPPP